MDRPPATIVLRGDAGLDRFDEPVASLSPWTGNPVVQPAILDVGGVTFIGPTCRALLAAAASAAATAA